MMNEYIAKLREDKNLWRTFLLGQKYYQKRAESCAPILDFLILVLEQLLMAHLGIRIDEAEELAGTGVEEYLKSVKAQNAAFRNQQMQSNQVQRSGAEMKQPEPESKPAASSIGGIGG